MWWMIRTSKGIEKKTLEARIQGELPRGLPRLFVTWAGRAVVVGKVIRQRESDPPIYHGSAASYSPVVSGRAVVH